MTKVYIVCGAGASSTFLAVKLRSLSQDLSHKLQFLPAALETVQPEPEDLVVVATHIADALKVQSIVDSGVTVIKLSEHAVSGFKAGVALAQIVDALKANNPQ